MDIPNILPINIKNSYIYFLDKLFFSNSIPERTL